MTPAAGTSRRHFLAGAGLVGGGIVAGTARDLLVVPAYAAAPKPSIHPRSDWGQGLKPKGALEPERDVKFLLVHHTAGANGYPAGAVPSTLRGIYSFHTGEKGWNDVAYNFFVDAHGGIWEGRTGSLDGPVVVDATGGSQGFAQLCCFLGNHQATPPTAAAQNAMTDLLAWLASRHDIDLKAGATVTFRSRGSNLHPAGTQVTTPTIAAHRDMSKTSCPGDACYRLVKGQLAATAAAKAGATGGATRTAPPAPAADPAQTTTAPTETDPLETSPPPASSTDIGEDNPPVPAVPAVEPDDGPARAEDKPSSAGRLLGLGGLGAAGALAGAVLLRKRRTRADAESRWYSSELLNPPMPPPDPMVNQPPESGLPGNIARRRPHPHRPDE